MGDDRCELTVLDDEGFEQPCDRPATGWRWYQDVRDHEDLLAPACDLHVNEGGRRMRELQQQLAATVELVSRTVDTLTRWNGEDGSLVVDAVIRHLRVAADPWHVRRCVECGCTDDEACLGGCAWVHPAVDLCSQCWTKLARLAHAPTCAFPDCPEWATTPDGMCVLHERVSVSSTGSEVDDKHSDGGHG